MGKNFKGIERFYPATIVKDAVEADDFLAAVKPGKPIAISADQLKKAKRPLVERLKKISSETDLAPLLKVWADVKAAL